MPAHIAGTASGAEGYEETTPEDFVPPMLLLLQALSPVVQEDPKNYAQGDIYNRLTGENYGTEVEVVLARHWKSRLLFPPEDSEERGRICWSFNGTESYDGYNCIKECPFDHHDDEKKKASEWVSTPDKRNIPPSCSEFYNFVVFVNGDLTPVVLGGSKTKLRGMKNLLTLAYQRTDPKGVPLSLWAGKYKITTSLEKTGKHQYYIYNVANSGWASELEAVAGKAFWMRFREVVIDAVHMDEPVENPGEETVEGEAESVEGKKEGDDDIPF